MFYELNIFLKYIKFKEINNNPLKFKFGGNHYGKELMIRDELKNAYQEDANKIEKITIFDSVKIVPGSEDRTLFNHNLKKIDIGTTVSYVVDENDNIPYETDINLLFKTSYEENLIYPFKPFAIDDEYGLTIIYYSANNEYENGDIIIDGGFTKLFNELHNEGTYRYVQNLIAFTTQYRIRTIERDNNNNCICPLKKQMNKFIDYNSLINNENSRNEEDIPSQKTIEIIFKANYIENIDINNYKKIFKEIVNFFLKNIPNKNNIYFGVLYLSKETELKQPYKYVPLNNELEDDEINNWDIENENKYEDWKSKLMNFLKRNEWKGKKLKLFNIRDSKDINDETNELLNDLKQICSLNNIRLEKTWRYDFSSSLEFDVKNMNKDKEAEKIMKEKYIIIPFKKILYGIHRDKVIEIQNAKGEEENIIYKNENDILYRKFTSQKENKDEVIDIINEVEVYDPDYDGDLNNDDIEREEELNDNNRHLLNEYLKQGNNVNYEIQKVEKEKTREIKEINENKKEQNEKEEKEKEKMEQNKLRKEEIEKIEKKNKPESELEKLNKIMDEKKRRKKKKEEINIKEVQE